MATLSSSSTDAEVRAAFDDNASYAEDNDTTKAAALETACLILLRREPLQGGRNGTMFALDKQSVREVLARVRLWLSARGASGGGASSRHYDFRNFRA